MKLLLKILTLLISMQAFAQQKELVAFYYKGNINIINKTGTAPIHHREILYSGSKIQLSAGAEIVLYNLKDNYIWLKNAAVYSTDSLASEMKNRKEQRFIAEFFSFLSKEFIKDDETIEQYATRHMKISGGVIRIPRCLELVFPPPFTNIARIPIHFFWSADKNKNFVFEIYPDSNKLIPLFTINTTDSLFNLKKDMFGLEKGKTYYWSVKSGKEAGCSRFSFKISDESETGKVKSMVDAIEKEKDLRLDFKSILKAAVYEENALLTDAILEYSKAIRLAPDQAEYENLYIEFLARHQLNQWSAQLLTLNN